MGLPFNRTADGQIDQRRFGGHTRNYGEGPVRRSCFAADRTGHMILQTLYQQCIKHGVTFFDEYHVVDLLIRGRRPRPGGRAAGVVAYRIADGELHVFRSKAVLLATGGFGRMFRITSNAWSLTGDGVALAYRHGLPAAGHGVLPVPPDGHRRASASCCPRRPAARAATCCNDNGERFMERYAPKLMELAPRDMVSRAIYQEIRGRPGHRRQGLRLPRRAPPRRKVIDEKLPDITEFARIYQGVEPHHRAGADPADRALRDGRHPDRPRTPG